VRGGAQPDHLRTERHPPVVAVHGLMMKRNVNGHGLFEQLLLLELLLRLQLLGLLVVLQKTGPFLVRRKLLVGRQQASDGVTRTRTCSSVSADPFMVPTVGDTSA